MVHRRIRKGTGKRASKVFIELDDDLPREYSSADEVGTYTSTGYRFGLTAQVESDAWVRDLAKRKARRRRPGAN